MTGMADARLRRFSKGESGEAKFFPFRGRVVNVVLSTCGVANFVQGVLNDKN